jgi:hypothetical protein
MASALLGCCLPASALLLLLLWVRNQLPKVLLPLLLEGLL